MNFFPSFLIAESEHVFGFNSNILETNVLNLAVVVGIVVFFGGKNLLALLDTRQQTIISNLREADQRASEAKEKFLKAKEQLEIAEKKATEIRQEGILKASKEKQNCLNQYELDLQRLEQFKQENLSFYQQKVFKQVYVFSVSQALDKVKKKFQKKFTDEFYRNVMNCSIERFTEYNS